MLGHPRVARTLFDLLVIIDGEEYRCAQVTTNFYLNKIPMASCTLAVGRHVHSLKPAKSHSALFTEDSGTQLLKEAEIRLIPKGDWRPGGEQWPNEALIFKGYVTGVGVRTMRGSIRPTVQIIHWLSDLNFSSALSNQSHPANPADLSWRAIYVGEDQVTTTSTPHFLHQMVAGNLFTPGKIKGDLWANCLQPLLWRLSEFDQIDAKPGLHGIEPAVSNAQSQKALRRIRGGENGAPEGPDYTPLTLQLTGMVDNEMAKAVEFFLKQELADAWWSTTVWNKLANEFAAAFMFAVIPQIEHAMIVPYIPGTRELWKTIKNDEYNYIDTVSVIPRPLQAVAIYAGIVSETGEGGTMNPGRELGVGGFYRPEGADKGMLLALRPSGWIARIPMFGENCANTASGDPSGSLEGIPSSTTPGVAPKKGNEWGHTIEETAVESKDMLDRLAHALYVQEVLRGRFGVVHGKLRFDIAPGSTVKIEGSADSFIGSDALRPNLIGEVHRVTCSLNAEGGKAGTSFQVVHLRTEEENEKDVTSVEKHPMYDQVFKGSPLSEDLAFRE